MTVASSIHGSLQDRATRSPDKQALLGIDGESFTYKSLWQCICETSTSFKARGITSRDCIAMVVPESISTALTFLSVSAVAKCAPLNPAYSKNDFEFYLEDLKPSALIIPAGYDTVAVEVAKVNEIPVWSIMGPSTEAPSQFALEGESVKHDNASIELPSPDSVALILHTSGTTSRPKMVPNSHLNLATSAGNVANTLKLSSDDRGLNVMPLFHIHGIVGCLLSSLTAGSSIVCGVGFKNDRFLDWAREFKINWYSAVPTIHQAVLAQAKENPEIAAALQFRFIRSSSAPLPPAVFHEMEAVWKAPVIESYGMTEASHQMTSNQLPPGQRKPGSVGVPAGPEVVILNDSNTILPQGQIGEIAIKGANVTTGYVANPEANAKAFTAGWFRTGDQGRFDEDGYLFLTGRLKEMINRGGENIAPKEIDEVLIEHDAVTQAVAFAVPHPTLGEDLAVAVVLVSDASVTENELRQFVSEKLADFKVPTRILFVPSIPKGPTGKLQRIGLFEKLQSYFETDFEAPEDEEEQAVATYFSEILEVDKVGRTDNFFYLGGDSLKAQRVLSRLSSQFNLEIMPSTFFRFPNPQLLGAEIKRLRQSDAELDSLAEELKDLSSEELRKLLSEE